MYEEFGPPQLPFKRVSARRHKAIFTAIAGYITSALVGIGLSTFVAGAVANIAIGAALLGIGQLASAAMGGNGSRQATSTPQAQATLNQSTGTRIRGYGWAKLGGTRAFWDSKNGVLYQIVMAHHGEIDAFVEFYIGDTAVALSPAGYVTTGVFGGPNGDLGYARIFHHTGSASQASDELMLTEWPEIWTANHRLRGIAYWAVRFASPPAEEYQTVFPEGYNTPVRCLCRLSKVWDPRTDTIAFEDNAALCILDYLTHPDGYNRSYDDIDIQSFADFADICGQGVNIAAGGNEKRYRIWGIYGLTDDPQDVLAKMRAACDAEFYQTAEGKIAIRGGAWQAPTVTIRDADILGHSMEQGNNRFSSFNELKLIYTSSAHDYQSMEATAWSDLADQAERGVLQSSLTLDMVPSASQARRLAKIHIAKSNPAWKGTIVANLSALDALGERTVRLVLPELDIDDAFFVAGFSVRPDLTGVEISVMSISEESYTWTTEEEGQSAPVPEDTRPDSSLPLPDMTLAKAGATITATAINPDRPGLELEAQIRAGAGSLWQPMQTTNLVATFGPTLAATTYQVRARWRAPLGSTSNWSALKSITT